MTDPRGAHGGETTPADDPANPHGGTCPACGDDVDGMMVSHLRTDCPQWGGGYQQETRADGGSPCGRRTCDRPAAVAYTTERGAGRSRCARHALEDGVDGVGPQRAAAIVDELTLDELVRHCDGADGIHAPVALSRIDGIGPSSAATIAENIDASPIADAIRDDERVMTDGGTETVLYLTTIECHDGHETQFAHRGPMVSIDQEEVWPDVTYCPTCDEPYPVDLGAATTEVAIAERVDPEYVTVGGLEQGDPAIPHPDDCDHKYRAAGISHGTQVRVLWQCEDCGQTRMEHRRAQADLGVIYEGWNTAEEGGDYE